jgi:hypothetical protein
MPPAVPTLVPTTTAARVNVDSYSSLLDEALTLHCASLHGT